MSIEQHAHIDDDVMSELHGGGLDASSERRARAHLAACASCRARYDEQTLLQRALAGASLDKATRHEDDGVLRRVLAETHPAPHADVAPEDVARDPARQGPPPRAARRRSTALMAFAGVAAAACIAMFVVIGRGGADAPVLAATVLHAKGATLQGAPLVEGAQIASGAVVDVAPSGLVEMTLVRGGTLRVFPDTALSLAPRGEEVRLTRGKVWAIVDGGRGPFIVRTDDGSARVLGTSFLVEDRDAATDVKVVEGRVEVRGATAGRDAPVVVNGGERTRVARGERATPPRRYDARDDRDQWQRFFDDLLRAMRQVADDVIRGVNDVLDPSHKR